MIFTDVHTDRQKLDVILGIKVVQFWSYQKMYFTKKVVLNWYYPVKKKFRKIRMIFDIENWLWKSDLGTFWWPLWTSVKVKSKKYFSFTDLFAKIKPLLTYSCKTSPLRSYYKCMHKSSKQRRDGYFNVFSRPIKTMHSCIWQQK